MSKTLKGIMVIISLLLIIIFAFNITKNEQSSSLIDKKRDSLYINFADSQLNHIFYQYDANTKENKILFEKKLVDYPTASYSRLKKEAFFTNKTKNGTSQLFKYNLSNKKTTQLTNEFYYVDFLEIDEKNQLIFMRVLLSENDRNFQIAIYDLKKEEVHNWNNSDADISVKVMDYNPEVEQLLVVTNSVKNEYEKITKANKKGIPPETPEYTLSIYNKYGEKIKDIDTIKKFITGAAISSNGKTILISYMNSLEETTSSIAEINIRNQDFTVLLEGTTKLSMIREPEYNRDNSGFYFLADTDKLIIDKENNSTENETTINFYNFNDGKISEVWSLEDGKTINFFIEK